MATLLFNTEGDTIRSILAKGVDLAVWEVALFMGLWMTMTTITYGISVPAGLFLPAIIIGCSMGQIYSDVVHLMAPIQASSTDESYILVGAAAVIAG